MFDVPHEFAERVRNQILQDMRPKLLTVIVKSGIAVLIGGAISLLMFGQFGIGLDHVAMHLSDQFHNHYLDPASALREGIAFAIIPPFILRMLCSAMQYRVIVRKPYVALLWFTGLGLVLAHHGHVSVEKMEFALWCGANLATFYLISLAIDKLASGLNFPWLSGAHPSVYR